MRILYAFMLLALCLWPCAGADTDLQGEIKAVSAKVHERLESFRCEGNCEALYEAKRLIAKLGYRHQQDSSVAEHTFRMQLEVLETCFRAQDAAYDFRNPPSFSTTVSPGLGPGLWAGMEPKDVKDPEIRKKYEEAITENRKRKDKYNREKVLHELTDDGICYVRGHLSSSQELGTIEKDLAIIRETIKDTGLMKKLEEEVFAEFLDDSGVPR